MLEIGLEEGYDSSGGNGKSGGAPRRGAHGGGRHCWSKLTREEAIYSDKYPRGLPSGRLEGNKAVKYLIPAHVCTHPIFARL